jgi:DNA-binding transcriptional LysR family regulator
VALGPGYGLRSLTDALFREAGFRPRIAFVSQDSHTVRGLVSAGLGVGILPPAAGAPGRTGRPQTGDLGWVEVPLDSRLAFREVGVTWRRRKPGAEPVPARLFRELVVAEGPGLVASLATRASTLVT